MVFWTASNSPGGGNFTATAADGAVAPGVTKLEQSTESGPGENMRAMAARTLNSVVRFVLELTALTVLSAWGWHALSGQPQRLVLAIAAPLVAATTWGLFVAPRASHFLALPGRIAVETLVFGSAALALVGLDRVGPAGAFAVIAGLNTALVHVWRQDVQAHDDASRAAQGR
jgi:hypothetical protein